MSAMSLQQQTTRGNEPQCLVFTGVLYSILKSIKTLLYCEA